MHPRATENIDAIIEIIKGCRKGMHIVLTVMYIFPPKNLPATELSHQPLDELEAAR